MTQGNLRRRILQEANKPSLAEQAGDMFANVFSSAQNLGSTISSGLNLGQLNNLKGIRTPAGNLTAASEALQSVLKTTEQDKARKQQEETQKKATALIRETNAKKKFVDLSVKEEIKDVNSYRQQLENEGKAALKQFEEQLRKNKYDDTEIADYLKSAREQISQANQEALINEGKQVNQTISQSSLPDIDKAVYQSNDLVKAVGLKPNLQAQDLKDTKNIGNAVITAGKALTPFAKLGGTVLQTPQRLLERAIPLPANKEPLSVLNLAKGAGQFVNQNVQEFQNTPEVQQWEQQHPNINAAANFVGEAATYAGNPLARALPAGAANFIGTAIKNPILKKLALGIGTEVAEDTGLSVLSSTATGLEQNQTAGEIAGNIGANLAGDIVGAAVLKGTGGLLRKGLNTGSGIVEKAAQKIQEPIARKQKYEDIQIKRAGIQEGRALRDEEIAYKQAQERAIAEDEVTELKKSYKSLDEFNRGENTSNRTNQFFEGNQNKILRDLEDPENFNTPEAKAYLEQKFSETEAELRKRKEKVEIDRQAKEDSEFNKMLEKETQAKRKMFIRQKQAEIKKLDENSPTYNEDLDKLIENVNKSDLTFEQKNELTQIAIGKSIDIDTKIKEKAYKAEIDRKYKDYQQKQAFEKQRLKDEDAQIQKEAKEKKQLDNIQNQLNQVYEKSQDKAQAQKLREEAREISESKRDEANQYRIPILETQTAILELKANGRTTDIRYKNLQAELAGKQSRFKKYQAGQLRTQKPIVRETPIVETQKPIIQEKPLSQNIEQPIAKVEEPVVKTDEPIKQEAKPSQISIIEQAKALQKTGRGSTFEKALLRDAINSGDEVRIRERVEKYSKKWEAEEIEGNRVYDEETKRLSEKYKGLSDGQLETALKKINKDIEENQKKWVAPNKGNTSKNWKIDQQAEGLARQKNEIRRVLEARQDKAQLESPTSKQSLPVETTPSQKKDIEVIQGEKKLRGSLKEGGTTSKLLGEDVRKDIVDTDPDSEYFTSKQKETKELYAKEIKESETAEIQTEAIDLITKFETAKTTEKDVLRAIALAEELVDRGFIEEAKNLDKVFRGTKTDLAKALAAAARVAENSEMDITNRMDKAISEKMGVDDTIRQETSKIQKDALKKILDKDFDIFGCL